MQVRRRSLGTLEFSVLDDREKDTLFVYNEVFVSQVYHSSKIVVAESPIIVDIGANIGLYTVWAQRRYHPQAIYCYEASPRTAECLEDNLRRLVNRSVTECVVINKAIGRTGGQKMMLHQCNRASAISTLLDRTKVQWIEEAHKISELETYEVTTSTISAEIEEKGFRSIDILKIDVEGYFMEVLEGIKDKDYPKIRNIVLEADYLPETGIELRDVEMLLRTRGYQTDASSRVQTNNVVVYAWRV